MLDIGYLAAFLGGLLALLSPCSALLLPSFFAYAFSGANQLLARTGVFFLGLAAVLVPLGVGSSAVGALLTMHRAVLISTAGWLIVVLGVVQTLGGGWSSGTAARLQNQSAARGTWVSTAVLGGAYGLAGFCTGPILGAVLTVAAAGRDPIRGALLLGIYALGMAAPLFALAGLWQRFDLGRRAWLRGRQFRLGPLRLHTTSAVSGVMFVAVGAVFLLFGGTAGFLAPSPRLSLGVENVVVVFGEHVPDVAVLVLLAVAVAAITWWRLRRTPARGPAVTETSESRPAVAAAHRDHLVVSDEVDRRD